MPPRTQSSLHKNAEFKTPFWYFKLNSCKNKDSNNCACTNKTYLSTTFLAVWKEDGETWNAWPSEKKLIARNEKKLIAWHN